MSSPPGQPPPPPRRRPSATVEIPPPAPDAAEQALDSDALPTLARGTPPLPSPTSNVADAVTRSPEASAFAIAPATVGGAVAAREVVVDPTAVTVDATAATEAASPKPAAALPDTIPPARIARAQSGPAPSGSSAAPQARPPALLQARAFAASAAQRLKPAALRSAARAKQAFVGARAFLATRHAALPTALRGRLPALLGVGIFFVLAAGVGIVKFRAAAHEPAPSSLGETPRSLEATVHANAPGSTAHPALASAEASEPGLDERTLLLNLASSLASAGQAAHAVALLERALLRDPSIRSDERVGKALLQTVYADDKATVNASFALLEGPMAERGAELMYELSLSRNVNDAPRRHAETWLRSKEFLKAAPFPLYTVVKLRQAKTCEDKRALLGLAAAGGKQTLEYLRELAAHVTCSPDDLVNCYPCLRAEAHLTDSILALEKRLEH